MYELTVRLRQCTYGATRAEWLAVADALEAEGEPRLAGAIRHGLSRKSERWYGPLDAISLRFRGGSVAKLDRYSDAAPG